MSRYIDADAIQYRKVCKEKIDGSMSIEYMVLRDAIDDMPTADVVEVVRCKDCKHYKDNHRCYSRYSNMNDSRNPNDYCSYGERVDK